MPYKSEIKIPTNIEGYTNPNGTSNPSGSTDTEINIKLKRLIAVALGWSIREMEEKGLVPENFHLYDRIEMKEYNDQFDGYKEWERKIKNKDEYKD